MFSHPACKTLAADYELPTGSLVSVYLHVQYFSMQCNLTLSKLQRRDFKIWQNKHTRLFTQSKFIINKFPRKSSRNLAAYDLRWNWFRLALAGIAAFLIVFSIKGFCHEMNIFWRLIIKNCYFCTYADSFYIFLFLSLWKTKTTFSLLFWNYELILKILQVTRLKDPKAEILAMKMLTGSRLWFWKIIPEENKKRLALENID